MKLRCTYQRVICFRRIPFVFDEYTPTRQIDILDDNRNETVRTRHANGELDPSENKIRARMLCFRFAVALHTHNTAAATAQSNVPAGQHRS